MNCTKCGEEIRGDFFSICGPCLSEIEEKTCGVCGEHFQPWAHGSKGCGCCGNLICPACAKNMEGPCKKCQGITPLAPPEAIEAMLDGETLWSIYGSRVKWGTEGSFIFEETGQPLTGFNSLYRIPEKTRPMTRYEIMAWVQSPESKGWLVNILVKGSTELKDDWQFPWYYKYDNYEGAADDIYEYVRAPLLPDLSGVNETKINKFEVNHEG